MFKLQPDLHNLPKKTFERTNRISVPVKYFFFSYDNLSNIKIYRDLCIGNSKVAKNWRAT